MKNYSRWNTDYNGNIIPETYEEWHYNPSDSTEGYRMYYLQNNTGWQVSNVTDVTLYYEFDYVYYQAEEQLAISFDTHNPNAPENYTADMLTLNDTLMVFENEYRSHWFEKAEMKKLGVFDIASRSVPFVIPDKKEKGLPIFGF